MQRREWLLLALEAAGTEGLSPVQLQKALFVFGARTQKISDTGDLQATDREYWSFRAYDYGPFAKGIYHDAEGLQEDGLVQIAVNPSCSRLYRITEQGLAEAAEVANRNSGEKLEYLKQLVLWIKSLSFETLLSVVYKNYPDMAVNSVFRGNR